MSTGAACSSGTLEPSHVLRAMGLPTHRAQNSIRFSLGAGNTDAEIDYLLEKLPRTVEKLRSLTGAARGETCLPSAPESALAEAERGTGPASAGVGAGLRLVASEAARRGLAVALRPSDARKRRSGGRSPLVKKCV